MPLLRGLSLRALSAFARALFLLAVCVPALRAAQRTDTLLAMSDGARISIAYFLPPTPRPAGGYPALVLVHGFAGSKNDYAPLAARYADSGYFCVAYTVRGQGLANPATASEGNFAWFTGERELEDCREVIEWTRARPPVDGDRVGLEGISQGGLTAWGAAIKGLNVKCIVPIIGVPLYSQAMAPNGTENYFLVTALAAADVFQLVRFDTWCRDSLYGAIQQDRYDDVARLLRQRDLDDRINSINVPVFMQMAWQDDIFSGRQFFAAFNALNVPKKLAVWPGPHALPTGALEEGRFALTLRFYRRWLKRDEHETIMNPDSAVVLVDPGNSALLWFNPDHRGRYEPGDANFTETRRLHFSPGLQLTAGVPQSPSAFPGLYVQNISNDAQIFRSFPFTDTVRMLGADASLMVNSTGRKYQANILLWDYDPATNVRRQITRGSYEVRLRADETPSRRRIEYGLSPQLYSIAPGHQLEAWIKFGIPGLPASKPGDEFGQTPYAPQESVVDTVFSSPQEPSYIDIYVARNNALGVEREEDIRAIMTTIIRAGNPLIIHLDKAQSGTMELFDISGARIYSGEFSGRDISIPSAGLSSGMYFLRMRSGDDITHHRFIVKD